MCAQNSAARSIMDIFSTIETLSYYLGEKNYICIPVEITTEDGLINKINISNSKQDEVSINDDVIVYNNIAINLDSIVKLKVFTQDIILKEFKPLLLKNFENILAYNHINHCPLNEASPSMGIKPFNNTFNSFNTDYNVQDYILDNIDNIKTLSYKGCSNTKSSLNSDIFYEGVLNSDTNLLVNRESLIKDINLDTDYLDVVSSIKKTTKKILKNIDTEKKLVLTNNSSEVAVSKPILTENVDVITDLKIKNHNVLVNQTPTKAIDKIVQNKIDSISNIIISKIDNILSDIDSETQIIETKTVEVLDLDPINKFSDKKSLTGKPLMLDPTGERYIGVVLDDGSFEPLKLSFKKFTIVDENVNNLVGNIDSKSQLKSVVSDLSKEFSKVLSSLDIEYNNNLLECNAKDMIALSDALITTKKTIKNIANEAEKTYAVSKENFETINSIKNMDYDDISHINNIITSPVVTSINLNRHTSDVLNDVYLNKNISNVINNITKSNSNKHLHFSENINGKINCVGNGVMIVDNADENITIYTLNKINIIN
ncbi:hypothetical protein VN21_04350 [Paraclostridium benzoelyticum]|uniref:Uncharacterized protein n=1 Tax=Paraclostridium benzoelyticum TaxID=1629550 RepID=A0A0M3DJ84_9FIRM|nr:hypothetical protein [Paraclostridium benzoelyticum]KKY02211.1 hypothetical protein VN21_04350 [Paraclostridium benzoelyticum]